MSFLRRDKSISMSMPNTETVHGVEVKKVPIGQYFKSMGSLQDVIFKIIGEVFPGKSVEEIVSEVLTISEGGTLKMMIGLIATIPEQIVALLCDITGYDRDIINGKTPAEVLDIFQAYWRINDMTSFFGDVRKMVGSLFAPKTGSSAGSPSPKA